MIQQTREVEFYFLLRPEWNRNSVTPSPLLYRPSSVQEGERCFRVTVNLPIEFVTMETIKQNSDAVMIDVPREGGIR